ncbi:MAG: ABC transporter ATP-binding protein [Chloroflexota bacterium]|nr:ABC transporter ATP-binding protein [Chloroflexota bacterium]
MNGLSPQPPSLKGRGSTEEPTPLLEVRDLAVRYGSIEALRGVSLSVMAGEFVAIVGPNGAGKSTLVNTIAGLFRPARGTIAFAGQRIGGLSAARVVQRGVAQAPEGRQVFSDLSVADNLQLGAYGRYFQSPFLVDGYLRLLGGRRAMRTDLDRVYALFPTLHDLRDRLAGTLSGGEQQMLALGRALMSEARLLMIDELSLGLAPIIVRDIAAHLRALNADGLTVLLVEQNVNLAFALAERVYVLEHGRVRAEGKPEELRQHPEIERVYLGSPVEVAAMEAHGGE